MLDYQIKQLQKFKEKNLSKYLNLIINFYIILFLVSAILICLLLFIFFYEEKVNQNNNFIVYIPSQIENEKQNYFIHEIICTKIKNNCFKIEDYKVEEFGEQNKNKYERRLMINNMSNIVLSIAMLIPKHGENFSLKTSAGWHINKNKLILPYTKAIIGQLFVNDFLVKNKKRQQILILGLGGGSISNFLSEIEGNHEIISVELEPAIEYISQKWFDLKNKSNHKIIIKDAIEYIKNWKKKDGHFECIIIDICYSNLIKEEDSSYPLICPLKEIVHDEIIITKIFEMLKEKGILLINTFSIETKINKKLIKEELQFLLELFRYHFGYCYFVDILYNKLLVCTLNPLLLNGKQMTNKLYKEKILKIPEWIQSEITENDIQVNILHDIL